MWYDRVHPIPPITFYKNYLMDNNFIKANLILHSPADPKLLMGGVKGLIDAWRLGILHVEYEKLKKIQNHQQQ